MTNGEALELLKRNVWYNEDSLKKHKELRNYKEANDLSIVALEKQILKPVVWSNTDYPRCPVCGHYVGVEVQEQYCPVCGQALDWEREDD